MMLREAQKPAFAYLRVSTRKQASDASHSFHVQKAQIERFAESHGYTILDFIYEVASGGDDNRPELKRAIELCGKGATLISAKVDRLCRSVEKIGSVMNSNISLRFVQLGDMEPTKVVLAIFGAIAEAEKDYIGLRTKEGLKMAKERGIVLGNPNILEVGKSGREASKRRADAKCLEVYAVISNIMKYGRYEATDAYLAKCLMARSVKTARGNAKWHPKQVRRVIDRAENIQRGA